MAELTHDEIREIVRRDYARAATSASCCRSTPDTGFGASQYPAAEREQIPPEAAHVSLGCGNPTAVAELSEGEVVLDLGSGGGIDVLLSAQRVGPSGKAYGLDMTPEMLELARANAARAGAENAEFLEGVMEDIPLADETVDVVVSNCVVNLSPDKAQVLREAVRVLRPGGRLAFTDIVADADLDEATRAELGLCGCIGGALTRTEFETALAAAGFGEIEIRETHRVHAQAGSAIVRARKPR